ncbi:MAG TPA: hypothetical protein VGD10_09520 [Allosphingosinicella sp.]|uniref:hypothetical protein n=1 Tax=Allosphingosinicella sp. TaxID=2823234 RepID=UPI002ED964E4
MSIDLAPALRVLGICALIGALTTFLNTMAPPFYSADSFESSMALIHNPIYAMRQWVLLVHPVFTLMLPLGMAFALVRRAPGRAASGLIFAGVEKMTEFLLGVTILFVVNGVWKVDFLATMGTPAAAESRHLIETFNQWLNGIYFLLWAMFILSTGLLASALDRRDRLELSVIVTAGVMIVLTAMMILGNYAGQESWTTPVIQIAYGPLLTLHRALIGVWLLREARRLRS